MKNKNYITIDQNNIIIDAFSEWQHEPLETDIILSETYESQNFLNIYHESGSFKFKWSGVEIVERNLEELTSEPKYKNWINTLIDIQLKELDNKRIRPIAELEDDSIIEQERSDNLDKLKDLNRQAKILRQNRII